MAEENDQNAVQPQNDEQQTVPMPPVDAEQTQTYAGESYAAESATEPIDVQGGIADQPTAAMPVANDPAVPSGTGIWCVRSRTDAAGWWHRLRERYCEWRCEWRAEHASAAAIWNVRADSAAAAASQSFLR